MNYTNEAWEEEQMSNLGCESVSDLIEEVKRLNMVITMLKKNDLWVSTEGWIESDKDDELLVSMNYLIQGFQELRGDFND